MSKCKVVPFEEYNALVKGAGARTEFFQVQIGSEGWHLARIEGVAYVPDLYAQRMIEALCGSA